MNKIISIISRKVYYSGITLQNPNDIEIEAGSTYVILGENGAGKSTLANAINKGQNIFTNRIIKHNPAHTIRSITFTDIHSVAPVSDSYYQQRWESTANEGIPTVEEVIKERIAPEIWETLTEKFGLKNILHKRINFLSSGETRKFQLVSLFSNLPDILIIDNPYIGLDVTSVKTFNEMLAAIATQGITVLMLLCSDKDIPAHATHIIPVRERTIYPVIKIDDDAVIADYASNYLNKGAIKVTIPNSNDMVTEQYETAFELHNCNICYGKNVILNNISWVVAGGERWALLGENGAGKSTLLSLVYADNPQAYANDITLFDRRRGTGESIWDIKRKIGYISPEMHIYFDPIAPVIRIVAAGLHNVQGNYKRTSAEEESLAMEWLSTLHVAHLAQRPFGSLSSGEQRMVLLARTFIKPSHLLILDEPLHGLDDYHKGIISSVVEQLTANPCLSLVYVTHNVSELPTSIQKIFQLFKNRTPQITEI
ncbi:MAG: ATP-binding cassette domain-containing protein [Bacteroidales bacterium]